MKFNIEKHLKERFQDISFLRIKEDAELNVDGYKLPYGGLDIPILNKELLEMIKEDKPGLSMSSIVRGIIETMGSDSDFLNNEEYKKMLYAFDQNIESYIVFEGLKKAEKKEFLSALVYFKCLILLKEDLNSLYNYALICQDLGRVYNKAKDEEKVMDYLKESLDTFEEIVSLYPEYPMSYYHLGYLYLNNKQYVKAKLNWKLALSMKLDDEKELEIKQELDDIEYKVQYEEGYNLVLQGNPQKGLEKLEPLLEEYSDWWNLLFFIGLALRQLNRYDEAIIYFEKIISINAEQVDALCEMGLCYAASLELQKAIELFEKALKLRPQDYEIMSNLGMLYLEVKDIDTASYYIELAYEINPQDDITIACLNELKKYQ